MKRRTALAHLAPAARLLLALSLFWLLALPSQAAQAIPPDPASVSAPVRYVAPGGACGGATPCHATVQAAVDAAAAGQVIKIAQGTYSQLNNRAGTTQVVHISKAVTLRGGYSVANGFAEPPRPDSRRTILDAHSEGRVVVIDGAGPTLEGLVITGGAGYDSGGGIYSLNGSAVIRNCEIADNEADGDGGGVFINRGSVQVLDSQIVDNRANWAGGLRIINNADATLIGNRIAGNVAQISGGGIDIDCCGGTSPYVARNLILDNRGGSRGGGVIVNATKGLLVNNIIAGNEASQGAGVWLDGSASHPATATLTHNTLFGSPTATDGVWVGESVTAALTNNIIDGFTSGITNNSPFYSTVSARNTLFHANTSSTSGGVDSLFEFHGNPGFLAPLSDDYHIGRSSAGLDQGQVTKVTEDFDGQRRSIGAAPDIGADELGWTVYLPGVLRRP
ncbi:MAG TPA: right-handed parallel beta-helix repeat-containing protein [Anaerolineae bacterium]|nr:right-handed parallel beta-helix repeat-containing protein [Anaerolineae bacterium]